MEITLPVSEEKITLKDSLTYGDVREYEIKKLELVKWTKGVIEYNTYLVAEKKMAPELVQLMTGKNLELQDKLNIEDADFLVQSCFDQYEKLMEKKSLARPKK